MSMIQELNRQFGLSDQLTFTQTDSGIAIAMINTPLCQAAITLQGAQVYKWQPAGEADVIWTSTQAKFAPGKSLRGGVPVCWPWFGPHADQKSYPAHGFARTVPWTVIASRLLADGRVYIEFAIAMDDNARAMWANDCKATLSVTLGKELEVTLTTTNTGAQAYEIGEALHTYFSVGDVSKVSISGLENCSYLDKVDNFARKVQQGAISIAQEVDRVYLDTSSECVIHDPVLNRQVHVQKAGSLSTVVWNPWHEKGQAMGDLGETGCLGMLCVESANAAQNVVSVAPGTSHTLAVKYYITH